jgi:hypothetical protein
LSYHAARKQREVTEAAEAKTLAEQAALDAEALFEAPGEPSAEEIKPGEDPVPNE